MDERKLYGFVDEGGQHVNLSLAAFGNPIVPVLGGGGLEPEEVQFFDSPSQADWFRYSLRERNLEYAQELDALSITWITQEFLNSGHYKLVRANCD